MGNRTTKPIPGVPRELEHDIDDHETTISLSAKIEVRVRNVAPVEVGRVFLQEKITPQTSQRIFELFEEFSRKITEVTEKYSDDQLYTSIDVSFDQDGGYKMSNHYRKMLLEEIETYGEKGAKPMIRCNYMMISANEVAKDKKTRGNLEKVIIEFLSLHTIYMVNGGRVHVDWDRDFVWY